MARAHIDFMGVWCGREPLPGEWNLFLEVVLDEIQASRMLEQAGLRGSDSRGGCQMLHRPHAHEDAGGRPARRPATPEVAGRLATAMHRRLSSRRRSGVVRKVTMPAPAQSG
jgi:hypothetical protein